MSGRIKLLKNGIPVNNADLPELGYQYDSISSFDASCGTFDLESSRLPQTECPDRFVCVPDSVNDDGLRVFASCIDAMNCFMLKGMTTGVSASSPTALFIHQMIPHHQNAVNMAKALLHFKNEVEQKQEVNCPDLTDEESSDCILEVILRQIVNAQNHQIQQMRGILTAKAFPESDDCGVTVDTVRNGQCPSDTDCKMLLIFPGNRVHKRFLGSRFCLSVCTSFPPSLYLNSGWDCGGCGD